MQQIKTTDVGILRSQEALHAHAPAMILTLPLTLRSHEALHAHAPAMMLTLPLTLTTFKSHMTWLALTKHALHML